LSTPITLTEYQEKALDLDRADAEFVLSELADKITLRRSVSGDQYVVNPNQFVGVVALPSGRRLESRPKVPLSNLFYMLAVVLDLPWPFREESAEFERFDELLEFIARYFTARVEERIDHGLYRAYVEREENLAVVRGRILFNEDVRHNYALRHRTYCWYSEFTWDVPENQILRQVVYLLSGWNFQPELQLRLRQLDVALSEVQPTTLPANTLDRFRYNRLNEDYRPLHQLCRLFLEDASLSEDMGRFEFRTFLIDMNKLFEKFVTQILIDRASLGIEVTPQETVYLAEDDRVEMRPDILVRKGYMLALVADCKYKLLNEGEHRNDDVYQLLAYCTATHTKRGLLIYPSHESGVTDALRVRHTDTQIHGNTIDLSKRGSELTRECGMFADGVFGFLQEDSR
jgi:5-methylcytosine-specific restriction enzyme subunit McrC